MPTPAFFVPALLTPIGAAVVVGSTAISTTLALQTEGGRVGFAGDDGVVQWWTDLRFIVGALSIFAAFAAPVQYRAVALLAAVGSLGSQAATEMHLAAENDTNFLGIIPIRKVLMLDAPAETADADDLSTTDVLDENT